MSPGIATADDVLDPRDGGARVTALEEVPVVERSLEAID